MKNLRIRVTPTWSIERTRKEMGQIVSDAKVAIWTVLKEHPEILHAVQQAFLEERFRDMTDAGVESPKELVTYLAEQSANLTGATVSISGNDEEASISFDDIQYWKDLRERIDLSREGKEQLLQELRTMLNQLASKFGFECIAEAQFDHPIVRVSFRRASAECIDQMKPEEPAGVQQTLVRYF